MNIPYGRQSIDEDDIAEVVRVLRSDYLTTGPAVEVFERTVADYVGAKYAVAVANGTAALHVACLAAGIGQGDEVITSPITFAASANCVLYCGGIPVFTDIDRDTYNMDPKELEKRITSRTKAIIPVHFAGQPCDMDRIHEIAQRHHLVVIEDAAHALGAVYQGQKIGGLSDMTIFSFHPVKPITTGEGGMIVTNDEALYEKLKLFRAHGITRDSLSMQRGDESWRYEQILLGYNYRITDIQCALGNSQMRKLDTFLKRRERIAHRYNEAFKGNQNLIVPKQLEETQSGWHLYVLQIKNHDRKQVFDSLKEAGIGVNVHYIPVYKHPYYQENGYADICCPNAEEIYRNIISLPLFPDLTEGEQDFVIEKVQSLVL